MGDEIEFRDVQVIQGGLLQIDIWNKSMNRGFRCFVDPVIFFSRFGRSMQINMNEWLQAFSDGFAEKLQKD